MSDRPDGVYFDLSREEYDNIVAVNWSTLKHMDTSPAHYQQQLLEWNHDTAARKRGRVGHLAVFEPDRWRSSVAVWDGDRRAGKEWEAFKARNQGLELLKPDEYQQVINIQQAVRSNQDAAPYLTGGHSEVSIIWTYRRPALDGLPAISIRCKSRLDFVCDFITDLKTARSAKPGVFDRQAWQLGYHTQLSFYRDAYAAVTGKRLEVVIVAAEPEPPWAVTVFHVPEYQLQAGRDTYQSLLFRLLECRQKNHWPAYAHGVVELTAPSWAVEQESDPTGLGLKIGSEAA